MNLVDKFKRKFRNFGISNLMLYIIITIGAFWAVDFLFPSLGILNYFYFSRDLILSGEIWRAITFLFIPSDSNPLFLMISLYFYYLIGSSLEGYWGKSAFTFYLLSGAVLTIISGFIGGFAVNSYLFMSLFLCYAVLNPEEQILLFFIIPIKIKYLGMIEALFTLWALLTMPLPIKLNILAALAMFLIVFGGEIIGRIKAKIRYKKFKDNFNNRR